MNRVDNFSPSSFQGINQLVAPQVIQTQESTTVHQYTGDLIEDEKRQLSVEPSTADPQIMQIAHTNKKFNITIRIQNLFDSNAQVIVNAANTMVRRGGGIDGAIHSHGGPVYAAAHQALSAQYRQKYISGFAAMLDSGNLKNSGIEKVIVVAGPEDKPTPEKEDQLYSCYYNSLVLAHSEGKKSIAFPSISTGIFGFPKDRAAAISMKAIFDFIKKHEDTQLTTISIHSQGGGSESAHVIYGRALKN